MKPCEKLFYTIEGAVDLHSWRHLRLVAPQLPRQNMTFPTLPVGIVARFSCMWAITTICSAPKVKFENIRAVVSHCDEYNLKKPSET